MGLRFRRSIKLFPGVRANFGLKSGGLSAGIPGLRAGFNTKRGRYTSVGIPGTGISNFEWTGRKKKQARIHRGDTLLGLWFIVGLVLAYYIKRLL